MHAVKKGGPYGVIAEYDNPESLLHAAQRAQEAGYSRMDAFTPFPVHGMPEAIGFDDARVPWTAFGAGVIGAFTGMGLQWWVSVVAYPHNIGGRPLFSWPSFIPATFETMILVTAFGAAFGMIMFNLLPQPHHPVFSAPNFDRASQDRFFLLIEARDPNYNAKETPGFLEQTDALNVSLLNEAEDQGW